MNRVTQRAEDEQQRERNQFNEEQRIERMSLRAKKGRQQLAQHHVAGMFAEQSSILDRAQSRLASGFQHESQHLKDVDDLLDTRKSPLARTLSSTSKARVAEKIRRNRAGGVHTRSLRDAASSPPLTHPLTVSPGEAGGGSPEDTSDGAHLQRLQARSRMFQIAALQTLARNGAGT